MAIGNGREFLTVAGGIRIGLEKPEKKMHAWAAISRAGRRHPIRGLAVGLRVLHGRLHFREAVREPGKAGRPVGRAA